TGSRFVWQVSVAGEHGAVNAMCDALSTRTIGVSASVRVPSLRPWRAQDVIVPPLDPRVATAPDPEPVQPPLIVTSGRLEPMKQFELLIRAMVLVRKQVPDATLQVLGGVQEGYESYADSLRWLRDDLGLTDDIEFTGHVDRPEWHWQRG